MFADSFSDSAWSNHSHRGWTTLISFALQALAICCLLLLPLLYTEGLPRVATLGRLLVPAPPPAAPAPQPRHSPASPAESNQSGTTLISPSQIPPTVTMLTETNPPPPVDPNAMGVRRGTGDPHARGSVFDSIIGSGLIVPPPPALPAVRHPPLSQMMEGNLVHRVQPEYPVLARQVRVQGTVVLRAIISREGAIEKVQVLSGHPMLVQAAIEAVRQWRYRPYVLNGEPVEVETEVTVKFILSGG